MPEQEEENVSQVETGEGETDQVASDAGVIETQAAAEKTVPYDRFKEVNDAKKAAEAQVQNLQAQFQIIQSQVQGREVQQMPQKAQDYFAAQGLQDDDFPSVSQIRAYAAQIGEQAAMQNRQVSAMTNAQRFIESKTDYFEMVGSLNYAGQFVPSEKFQNAMVEDPSLARDYMSGVLNTPQAAYRAVKAHEAAQELAVLKGTAKEQKHVKQAALRTGPLSPAAVGGGGSVSHSVFTHPSGTPEGEVERAAYLQNAATGNL